MQFYIFINNKMVDSELLLPRNVETSFGVCYICTMIIMFAFLRPSGLISQPCLLAIWFNKAVDQLVNLLDPQATGYQAPRPERRH